MINKKLREYLSEEYPEAIILDNPSYDNSICGVDNDGRLIYDFDKMVKELSKDDKISKEESSEFIEYNTIRALPYCGEMAPIIQFKL